MLLCLFMCEYISTMNLCYPAYLRLYTSISFSFTITDKRFIDILSQWNAQLGNIAPCLSCGFYFDIPPTQTHPDLTIQHHSTWVLTWPPNSNASQAYMGYDEWNRVATLQEPKKAIPHPFCFGSQAAAHWQATDPHGWVECRGHILYISKCMGLCCLLIT